MNCKVQQTAGAGLAEGLGVPASLCRNRRLGWGLVLVFRDRVYWDLAVPDQWLDSMFFSLFQPK